MKQLWRNAPGVLGLAVAAFIIFFLTACNEPIVYNQLRYGDMTGEIWDGYNPNKIRIRCGKECKTLQFQKIVLPANSKYPVAKLQLQKKLIHQFLRQHDRRKLVYVAPCATWPIQTRENRQLTRWVANEVSKAGYSVWITKPVVPYAKNTQVLCVNLLRGSLGIIAPNCPNLRVKDSVYRISSDFGCSTNRNLATMINNPWDLLAPPGERGPVLASRLARGNMDYNNGVKAKFMQDRPDRTNADTSTNTSPNAVAGY